MRIRIIEWITTAIVVVVVLGVLVLYGCAATQPTSYYSDNRYYPYYHPVEEDHAAFVYGPDRSQNGFVSSDGKMIFGHDRKTQFTGRE